jgi:hypothetical protein
MEMEVASKASSSLGIGGKALVVRLRVYRKWAIQVLGPFVP